LITRRKPPRNYSRYQAYKRYLRLDFVYRCAYCTIHEYFCNGIYGFHVDHFRPKSQFPQLECVYENLYYACAECNVSKGQEWPSEVEAAQGLRYVDPCTEELYKVHLRVNDDGSLVPLTRAGEYTLNMVRLDRERLAFQRKTEATAKRVLRKILPLLTALRANLETFEPGPEREVTLLLMRDLTEEVNLARIYVHPPVFH
jgi:hypothetical protein